MPKFRKNIDARLFLVPWCMFCRRFRFCRGNQQVQNGFRGEMVNHELPHLPRADPSGSDDGKLLNHSGLTYGVATGGVQAVEVEGRSEDPRPEDPGPAEV